MAKSFKPTSGCEEDLHPLMLNIINTFCLSPPIRTVTSLVEHKADRQKFDLAMTQILNQLVDWVQENRELVEILGAMCPGAKIIELENGTFAMEDFYITPEVEEAFLIKKKHKETPSERTQRLKRDKLISAIAALMSLKNIEIFEDKGKIELLKIFCCTLAFQLIRFAAGFTIFDGLDRQKKRRSLKGKTHDREGLLATLRKFDKQYPDKGPTELWEIIVSHIKQKKYRPLPGYYIYYEFEPTNTSKTGGWIVQSNSTPNKKRMKFQTFEKMLKGIRK